MSPISVKPWIKSCALMVVTAFIIPQVAWTFDAAAYPATMTSPLIQHGGKSLAIPKKIGTIIDGFQGKNKTVVLINDLHCNYEVQKNIAAIIDRLVKSHQVSLIGEEGAFDSVDLSVLREYPLDHIKEAVTDYYVKQGKLTGAEYYVANSKQPVRLEGIEDASLYQDSYNMIQSFLNAESQGYCYDLRDSLNELKTTIYNQKLRKHDNQVSAYQMGKTTLLTYALYLNQAARQLNIALTPCPNFYQFVSAKQDVFTAKVNPELLYRELEVVDHLIREQLYTSQVQRQLDNLIGRMTIIEKLLNISVTAEELAEFRAQREAFEIQAFLDFMAHHTDRSSWVQRDVQELYGLNNYLTQVDRFYHLADARSEAFVDKLLTKMDSRQAKIAVMVNGGFHTAKVMEELQQRAISYVSIQPALTRQDVINPYFSILQGRQLPIEKLLEQNQHIFATRIWPEANPVVFNSVMELPLDTAGQVLLARLSEEQQAGLLAHWNNYQYVQAKTISPLFPVHREGVSIQQVVMQDGTTRYVMVIENLTPNKKVMKAINRDGTGTVAHHFINLVMVTADQQEKLNSALTLLIEKDVSLQQRLGGWWERLTRETTKIQSKPVVAGMMYWRLKNFVNKGLAEYRQEQPYPSLEDIQSQRDHLITTYRETAWLSEWHFLAGGLVVAFAYGAGYQEFSPLIWTGLLNGMTIFTQGLMLALMIGHAVDVVNFIKKNELLIPFSGRNILVGTSLGALGLVIINFNFLGNLTWVLAWGLISLIHYQFNLPSLRETMTASASDQARMRRHEKREAMFPMGYLTQHTNQQVVDDYETAESYNSIGENDTAIEKLQNLLKDHPDLIPLWVLLGDTYLDAEQADEAAQAYQTAQDKISEAGKQSGYLQQQLAQALARSGRLEQALVLIDRAAEWEPEDRYIAYDRASLYALAKRYNYSLGLINAWLEDYPDDQEVMALRQIIRDERGAKRLKRSAKQKIESLLAHVNKKPVYQDSTTFEQLIAQVTPQLAKLFQLAEQSSRLRTIETIHEIGANDQNQSPINGMINVLQPGTYVRPHRHGDGTEAYPDKKEYYYVVEGQLAIVTFNDQLEIDEVYLLDKKNPYFETTPRQWHTVVALQPTAILEFKDGPYNPQTDKQFHPQTPEELYDNNQPVQACRDFVASMELAVLQRISRPNGEFGAMMPWLLERFLQQGLDQYRQNYPTAEDQAVEQERDRLIHDYQRRAWVMEMRPLTALTGLIFAGMGILLGMSDALTLAQLLVQGVIAGFGLGHLLPKSGPLTAADRSNQLIGLGLALVNLVVINITGIGWLAGLLVFMMSHYLTNRITRVGEDQAKAIKQLMTVKQLPQHSDYGDYYWQSHVIKEMIYQHQDQLFGQLDSERLPGIMDHCHIKVGWTFALTEDQASGAMIITIPVWLENLLLHDRPDQPSVERLIYQLQVWLTAWRLSAAFARYGKRIRSLTAFTQPEQVPALLKLELDRLEQQLQQPHPWLRQPWWIMLWQSPRQSLEERRWLQVMTVVARQLPEQPQLMPAYTQAMKRINHLLATSYAAEQTVDFGHLAQLNVVAPKHWRVQTIIRYQALWEAVSSDFEPAVFMQNKIRRYRFRHVQADNMV